MMMSLCQHELRSSLSFTKADFDILSEYKDKGTTQAWVALQIQLVLSVTSCGHNGAIGAQ